MIYVQTCLQCSAVLYLTGKPVLHSQSSSLVYLNLELLDYYCTVLPGETIFSVFGHVKNQMKDIPIISKPSGWLHAAEASRPHTVCLYTSSRREKSFLHQLCTCSPGYPGSRHTYFTALGHFTLTLLLLGLDTLISF